MFVCCATAPVEEAEGVVDAAVKAPSTEDAKEAVVLKEEAPMAETAPPTAETTTEDAKNGEEQAAEAPKEERQDAEERAAQEDAAKEVKEEAAEVEAPKEEMEPAACEEKKVPERGVVLEFHEGSAPVVITRRPVQLSFSFSKTPVQVCKVEGHAAELGIQEGWTVKSLDGVAVDADFQVFYSSFVHRLNDLEGDYILPLLFEKSNGEKKTCQVPSAPIGLSFNKTMPITIESSKGLAAQLGLQKGWRLLKYADKVVDAHADFNAFWADFMTFAAKLPKKN